MVPGLSLEHLVILGVIALVVVGPKELPLLLRKLGQFTAKLRGMAQEFRTGFDELARQAELDELKKEVEALRRTSNLNDITQQLAKPLGTLESYAGLPPPNYPPAPEEKIEPPSAGNPGAGAAEEERPPTVVSESHADQSSAVSASPPQSPPRDDSSPSPAAAQPAIADSGIASDSRAGEHIPAATSSP